MRKMLAAGLIIMLFLTGDCAKRDREAQVYVFNRAPLAESPFAQLPVGAIEPSGWLRTQLELAAEGATGELDEIWEDVGPNSGWLGGSGESWERGPYWCDGLVPLAYVLKDKKLIMKAQKWIEWTLNSQRPDGFFGPEPDSSVIRNTTDENVKRVEWNKADWWPRMVMLKVLQTYYEATADKRVIDFLTKYFTYQQSMLDSRPLPTWTKWAEWRGGENLASIYWLYNRTGEKFLLELAQKVFEQTSDWTNSFLTDTVPTPHGVNVAMGIKQPAVYYQQSGNKKYLEAVSHGIGYLRKNHGQVQGLHSGDEPLHSTDPAMGTELCSVVEYMFSMESVLKITGDALYADILERVSFNALPTMITPDLRLHQYYQQPNQVLCTHVRRDFYLNGPEVLLYGLEPNYGCCTANMHQGWPKLAMNLWLATPDKGLAAVVYAPCRVTARVAGGEDITFTEHTEYPFRDVIDIVYSGADGISFPLRLRIPGWCDNPAVSVNGEPCGAETEGGFIALERSWKDGDTVTLRLPMKIRISRWNNNSAGVERGPLVYALKIKENWKKLRGEEPYADWEVYPGSPWNYGLILDTKNPEKYLRAVEKTVAAQPFDAEKAPVEIRVMAKKIPSWKLRNESAAPLPHSPVKVNTPAQEVTLIPYGASRLRIAEFPYIEP